MAHDPPNLLLASRSPRRLDMLREHGFHPRVQPDGIDDGDLVSTSVPVAHWTMALAYLKARHAIVRLRERPRHEHQGFVLGADTVVEHEGRVIGQPRDFNHAREILTSLRAAPHRVVTGVALIDVTNDHHRILFADTADVWVGPLSDEDIETYLETGLWRGKAGAYNLCERLDAGWPIEFHGDPTTIMGLPMNLLVTRLDVLGIRPHSHS